jgi:peptide-methionine (R)-S-oxide reductase
MNVTRRRFLAGAAAASATIVVATACARSATASPADEYEVTHTDAEWKQLLTADQYYVLRNAGTESPYSSPLNDEHRPGVFSCAGCALDLFSADTKFDSGTGWPSFWRPLDAAVIEHRDDTFGMSRTEVLCRRCGGHLGHVFDDGPQPTGLRYCVNGDALAFRPA